jgi:glycosyltransferase involved in cell wall biosynthesis
MSREPLKIVLLADASSPNVQSWRVGLERAGCVVHLLSLDANLPSGDAKRFYYIPMIRLPKLLEKLRYFFAVPHTRKLIAQIEPDIVLAYYVSGYGTLGALSNFHPIVQITAGGDIFFFLNHLIMKRIVQYNLKHAELITSWLPHMTEATTKFGVNEDKIMTLPRGIDLTLFTNVESPYPQNREPVRIISTRTLDTIYHIDKLIKAVGILRTQGINCMLTIVGDGPDNQMLKNLTSALSLDSYVQFTGRLSNRDLPGLLSLQDLYVSLVDEFGVSASLLEVMAIRVFPIVFDNIPNRYWIEPGKNGLLAESVEPPGVAFMIAKAVNDLALRQQAWEINPTIVRERADLERNTAVYANRFRQLVKNYSLKKRAQ